MYIDDVIDQLNKYRNGALIKIEYEGDLSKYLADKNSPYVGKIHKTTTYFWRKGIDYKNQKSVRDEVEAGTRELTHQAPRGFEYDNDPNRKSSSAKVLVNKKTNELAIQFFDMQNNPHKPISKYFLNGKEITWEDLVNMNILKEHYVETVNKGIMPKARTVYIKNIVRIY